MSDLKKTKAELIAELQAGRERLAALERRLAAQQAPPAGELARLREAERERSETERKFRNLVEGSLQGILVHRDFTLLFANQAMADLCGYPSGEAMVGLDYARLIPGDELPDRRERYAKRMAGELVPTPLFGKVLRRDGTPFEAETMARRIEWEGQPALQVTVVDISERKRAERELRASEQRFRDFAEISSDWFWEMGPDLRFTWFSERVVEVMALPMSFLIGKTRKELAAEGEDPEHWARHLEDLRQRRPFRDFRYWRRGPDGGLRYLSISGTPVFDEEGTFLGYRGTGADITAAKQAEDKLAEGNWFFDIAQEVANIGVWARKLEQNELYWSPQTFRIFGLEPSERMLTYEELCTYIHPDDLARFDQNVQQALGKSEPIDHEHRIIRADGEERVVHQKGYTMFNAAGVPIRRIGVIHDITERKRLEDQLRQAQKLEAVGQLAGGVAHEFNNILQVIKGFAGLGMEGTAPDDPARQIWEPIVEATDRATELVKQLLSFGQRQMLNPDYTDINGLVSRFSRFIQPTLGEHIRFIFHPGGALRLCWADAGSIEQILMNLCINARDAMPEGGQLTLATNNRSLDEAFCRGRPWARPGDYVRISVSDTGEGMDESRLPHIFEPFFTTKGPRRGSGLGLSMVYGLVEQHGGLIHVSSHPGLGSTFDIYIPVEGPAELQPAPAAGSGADMTVLVAEGDPSVQRLACQTLESGGYRVLSVPDGRSAVELIQANAERISLVLLEWVMPDAAGDCAFQSIRSLRPDVPILFHAAQPLNGDEAAFVRRNGLQVLEKPYGAAELRRAVGALLLPAGGGAPVAR